MGEDEWLAGAEARDGLRELASDRFHVHAALTHPVIGRCLPNAIYRLMLEPVSFVVRCSVNETGKGSDEHVHDEDRIAGGTVDSSRWGAARGGPCRPVHERHYRDWPQAGAIAEPRPGDDGDAAGRQATNAPTPAAQPAAPGTVGTSADNRVGGTAGTKELNSSVGNLVATSSQDVRLQQEGKPTAAAAAAQGSARSVETTPDQAVKGNQPNDRMSEAKVSLERARALDQANDPSCSAAITRTKELMGS